MPAQDHDATRLAIEQRVVVGLAAFLGPFLSGNAGYDVGKSGILNHLSLIAIRQNNANLSSGAV
jgi:hypothetical protein